METRTIGRKDFAYAKTMGSDLPVGFGANFNDDPMCRGNLRRSHTLGTGDVQHPEEREDPQQHPSASQYDFTRMAMVSSAQAYGAGATGLHLVPRNGSSDAAGSTMRSTASTGATPIDDTVLRFLGFYEEAVPESPDERTRVHKVALLFHCADATILLREAVQVNSGLPQGVLLKRQKVPKAGTAGGETLALGDLNVGSTVTIFGKHIKIVDASAATRDYLSERGVDVSEALPWPNEDTYNATVQTKLTTQPKRKLPTSDFDHKRALEAMRGSGVISKHSPDDVRTAQQFLRNHINEHLQFAAYWDDRGKMSGDLRLAVVRYYLENDTIEVVEQRPENSGREGAAKLLCRQRVAHPAAPVPPPGMVQQNTFGLLVKSEYLTFDDLSVGAKVPLAGHTYTLYDADAFTRKWYRENRGVELGAPHDITAVLSKGQRPTAVHYPPPHSGFGSEEDSLRSCKSLMLKPPPHDVAKAKREGGKVMVFRASLATSVNPEDAGREFIVSFHRATDEVEIAERQLRNTGIVGGKFLARGRHLKTLPDGRRVPYTPDDFTVGGSVAIAGRRFQLDVMDERSRRQVAGEVSDVSEDRVKQLIVAFRELLNAKYYRAHEAYRAVAPEGTLTAAQIQEFFARSAGDISDEEASHLIHYFTAGDGSGKVTFDRFRKIMDPGNTTNLDEAVNTTRSIKGVQVFARSSEDGTRQAETLRASCDAAADQASGRRLHKALAAKLVQRRGTVQESFRMLAGHAPSARLSMAAFDRSIEDVLRLAVTPRERTILTNMLFTTEQRRTNGVDFSAFSEFVEAAN